MRTYQQKFRYEQLELLNPQIPSNPSTPSPAPSIAALIKGAWQAIVNYLVVGSEVQVRKMSDSYGETWWHIYDPKTRTSVNLISEDDVRVWIEESYYRQPDRLESLTW